MTPAEEPIRVVIVDDSAFTRKAIARILSADPLVRVVAEAGGGEEALQCLAETTADVVTLDLDMPNLDGLGVLQRVRQVSQAPVVVLSGRARAAPEAVRRAYELGAYDVLAKPAGGPTLMRETGQALLEALRAATGRATLVPERPVVAAPRSRSPVDAVLIGVSTGGPQALQQVLTALPANFQAPVVVLQHMPPGHTRRLANRLDVLCKLRVREAAPGDVLQAGTVLVAPSGCQFGLRPAPAGYRVLLADGSSVDSFYRPCIDHTFTLAARLMGPRVLGIVMTGMGKDGAEGLGAIKAAGGLAWAQDEASSAMPGMPRAAAETGQLDEVLPLGRIAARLVALVSSASTPPGAP